MREDRILIKLEEIKQEIIKLQPKPVHLKQQVKLDNKSAKKLLEYIESSKDFPDYELANNIEKASKDFRKNFKLK